MVRTQGAELDNLAQSTLFDFPMQPFSRGPTGEISEFRPSVITAATCVTMGQRLERGVWGAQVASGATCYAKTEHRWWCMNRQNWSARLYLVWLAGLLIVTLAPPSYGGGGPENVAVVVNDDSWASQTIANEFIHLRGIPTYNVVYLSDLPSFERVDVDVFREKILEPVMNTLFRRGVLDHIDCIAYSADLPTAIDVTKDFPGIKLPPAQAPVASISGLTYLYQLVALKRQEYLRLDMNHYMRLPSRSLLSIPAYTSVPKDPKDLAEFQQCSELLAKKDYAAVRKILEPLAKRLPDQSAIQYNLACCLARLEEDDAALDALMQAVLAGWTDDAHALKDPDLELLRNTNNFKALIGKMKDNQSKPFEVQPTTAFSSQYVWDALGNRTETPGLRYMLSTMLAVTSGRGNSVTEALEAMRRSVAADATQPRGTVYFMENGDVRSTTRRPVFVSAILALQGTPLQGKIEQGVLPQGKSDVAGAMVGSASFNWKQSGSTMLPGAICEHLTSYGGIMTEGSGQTPLSEFIRYGAAGSSGTVHEPLAIPAKFPIAFMHSHYAHGCSLAEAFYQSVFGPYQLLIVGDPLCQPWAKPLQFKVDSPQPDEKVAGLLTIEPAVIGGAAEQARLGHYELYVDGRQGKRPAGDAKQLTIDTRQLGDGWHELSIVAVANDAVETRSRVVIPLEVRNGVGAVNLQLVGNKSSQVTYGAKLQVNVSAPLQAPLAVAGNGRMLGTVEGPEGDLEIDTTRLGIGPVWLQAGTLIEGKPVFSSPVLLQIEPPATMRAQRVAAADLKPGLAVSIGGDAVQVVEDTKKGDWLASLKPTAGQGLKLHGYVVAGGEPLHQFQLRGNAASQLRVDGKILWQADDPKIGADRWVMVPVQLAPGYHAFEIRGTVSAGPSLAVRFGWQGCQSLGSGNVKYSVD